MGRPTEISVDDVVECVEKAGEPMTAPEVAEILKCSKPTALEKLDLAVEHGRLHGKKPHESCRIFWADSMG